jgi:ABC-type transport system involved in multi-copper enzyme maturation permease subunit
MVVLALVRLMTIGRELPEVPADAGGPLAWFAGPPAVWLRSLTGIQFWFVVSVVTLRSGAGVIAEDFTNRAYQFYFAKPVTPIQYLLGRAAALAIFLFGLVAVPTVVLALVLAATGPEEQLLENCGLLLPALLDAAIIASSCAILSVAISALSKSRALTMMAWGVVLFVPAVLASLIEGITEHEWAWLASPAGLLWVIGNSLYKVQHDWDEVLWYHAAPVLALLTAGGAYLALRRIQQAEVIT